MTLGNPFDAVSTISFFAFMGCFGRQNVDSWWTMSYFNTPHWRGMVLTASTTSFPSHHLPFVLGWLQYMIERSRIFHEELEQDVSPKCPNKHFIESLK